MAQPSGSDLPQELLELIFNRLKDGEVLHCGHVCVSWQSAVMEVYHKFIPSLLIPNNDSNEDTRSLLTIWTKRLQKIHLPEARGRWLCSATNGWLLTTGITWPHQMHLLNPFTRTHILPPPTRDEKWMAMESPEIPSFHIMLCKGQFYVTDNQGNVVCFEFGPHPKAETIATRFKQYVDPKYLVESLSGHFWLVLRYIDWEFLGDNSYVYHPMSFEIFKLDLSMKKWSEVKSLGDEALFLGHNGSISVSTRYSKACRGNCIYFLNDDYWEGYFRM
ncbi:hypothetical protein L1049_001078 [Liquidambar formosana]|uniref:F-box protein n=1 Tax=Liquidambar formosana TaxID=63359 RepID=A0AAP0R3R4_LIQFO